MPAPMMRMSVSRSTIVMGVCGGVKDERREGGGAVVDEQRGTSDRATTYT